MLLTKECCECKDRVMEIDSVSLVGILALAHGASKNNNCLYIYIYWEVQMHSLILVDTCFKMAGIKNKTQDSFTSAKTHFGDS